MAAEAGAPEPVHARAHSHIVDLGPETPRGRLRPIAETGDAGRRRRFTTAPAPSLRRTPPRRRRLPHPHDALNRARRLLTKAHERLDDRGEQKLVGLLEAGDPRGEGAHRLARQGSRALHLGGHRPPVGRRVRRPARRRPSRRCLPHRGPLARSHHRPLIEPPLRGTEPITGGSRP